MEYLSYAAQLPRSAAYWNVTAKCCLGAMPSFGFTSGSYSCSPITKTIVRHGQDLNPQNSLPRARRMGRDMIYGRLRECFVQSTTTIHLLLSQRWELTSHPLNAMSFLDKATNHCLDLRTHWIPGLSSQSSKHKTTPGYRAQKRNSVWNSTERMNWEMGQAYSQPRSYFDRSRMR